MSTHAISAGPWLAPDEPPAFELVNAEGRGRAILACDHASPRIPRRLGDLGLSGRDRIRHVAWDIGAAVVARAMSEILDSPLILTGYSRLVIDCNRPLHVADAFVTRSDDVVVLHNQRLSEVERAARAEALFWPYHDALHRLIAGRCDPSRVPALVSVHSFTPVHSGNSRAWHIGVQYRRDARLARLVLQALRRDEALRVGDNEPYPVALDEDYTVPVHAETRGMPYVLLEIRQDLIETEAGARAWAERLANAIAEALEDPSVDHFCAPAPDVRERRYE